MPNFFAESSCKKKLNDIDMKKIRAYFYWIDAKFMPTRIDWKTRISSCAIWEILTDENLYHQKNCM